jgi:hypothetical protein
MKKYAILTDDDNRSQVISSLEQVGFKVMDTSARLGIWYVCVNGSAGKGMITFCLNINYVYDHFEVIDFKYVFQYAERLEGSEAWRVAPEGQRLCTKAEHLKVDKMPRRSIAGLMVKNKMVAGGWCNAKGHLITYNEKLVYSVPEGFTFPEPWEIAPEGFQILTIEERLKVRGMPKKYRPILKAYNKENSGNWFDSSHAFYIEESHLVFATQICYRFPKPWELIPEGYRKLTKDERNILKTMPRNSVSGLRAIGTAEGDDTWFDASGGPHSATSPTLVYVVPLAYEFLKPEPWKTLPMGCRLASAEDRKKIGKLPTNTIKGLMCVWRDRYSVWTAAHGDATGDNQLIYALPIWYRFPAPKQILVGDKYWDEDKVKQALEDYTRF